MSRLIFIIPLIFSIISMNNNVGSEVKTETKDLTVVDVEATPTVQIAETTEDKIKRYFPDDYEIAIAIAKAESGLDKNATHKNRNGSTDSGLMQINSIHCAKFDCNKFFDEEYNLYVAKQIKDDSGWYAWSSYKSGVYKRYLTN